MWDSEGNLLPRASVAPLTFEDRGRLALSKVPGAPAAIGSTPYSKKSVSLSRFTNSYTIWA